MPGKINTVLVDHKNGSRNALFKKLNADRRFICSGDFSSANDAITAIPRLKPDVVILKDSLSVMSLVEIISRLKCTGNNTLFMIYTDIIEFESIFSLLKSGAKGYVLKKDGHKKLFNAVITLFNEGIFISNEVLNKMIEGIQGKSYFKENLTDREKEILVLLGRGSRYQEISNELFISLDTVKSHTQHIYKKLGVSSRTQAVIKASIDI